MAEEKIIAATGSISTNSDVSGSITGEQVQYIGSLEAIASDENDVAAVASLNGSVGTLIQDNHLNGSLVAQNAMDGAASATLTMRVGNDGIDGRDGFSPTIDVYKDTKTEYILRVTDVNGSYLTPNLYPDLEGLQDIPALVAGKVDKDLSGYIAIQPTTLNTYQRENSSVYVNTYDGKARKIALSEIALESEVNDKLRTKIQTVSERPEEDWRLGDYIFLDNDQEDGE